MGAVRGVVAGVLGLTFLETVVSSQQAAGRVSGFFQDVSKIARHLLSADVPLIPDRRYVVDSRTPNRTPGTGTASLPASQFAPVPTRTVAPTVSGRN